MERHEIKHLQKRLREARDALCNADYVIGELDDENDQLKGRIQVLESALEKANQPHEVSVMSGEEGNERLSQCL